jgi:hypothetical protein
MPFLLSFIFDFNKQPYKSNSDENDDSCIINAAIFDHRFTYIFTLSSESMIYFAIFVYRVQTLAESSTSLQRAIEHFGSVSQMMSTHDRNKPVHSTSSWSSSRDDDEVVDWMPESKCTENLTHIMDNCEVAKNQVIFLLFMQRKMISPIYFCTHI